MGTPQGVHRTVYVSWHFCHIERTYRLAKRRMISQNMNYDEELNSMTIEAQWLFNRLLSITDDCGVIPYGEKILISMLNINSEINPVYKKISGNFGKLLNEILNKKLLIVLEHNSKKYLCFKSESFDEYQSYLIKNRTKSEYLKITKDMFFQLYDTTFGKLREKSGISGDNDSYHIESKEHRVISRKQKEETGNFCKPEIEEVKNYFSERGINSNEYEKYFDFYESKNWYVGKNKMKDWKAAVRNWIRGMKETTKSKKTITNEHGTFEIDEKGNLSKI